MMVVYFHVAMTLLSKGVPEIVPISVKFWFRVGKYSEQIEYHKCTFLFKKKTFD